MAKIKEDFRPLGSKHSWAQTPGTYLAGQSAIDGADAVANEMERHWGADRLRLLVSQELREKFDRQRFKLNAAIWHGDLQELTTQARRMEAAWRALHAAAEALGALPLAPEVWELALDDGTVVALVHTSAEAKAVVASGRKVVVYTLEELGRMLQNYHAVTEVKIAFPGATVERMTQDIPDPLQAIRDANALNHSLNDELPDLSA